MRNLTFGQLFSIVIGTVVFSTLFASIMAAN